MGRIKTLEQNTQPSSDYPSQSLRDTFGKASAVLRKLSEQSLVLPEDFPNTSRRKQVKNRRFSGTWLTG